ncbi:MAG: hypothetical protein ABW163_06290 [Luteimonas sp.]
MQQIRITGYQVMYSANRFPPRIWLSGDTGAIGQLVFHANGEALPEDGLQGAAPSLHYHLDDFHNALDLLRSGGAVWLLYSGSGGGFENGLRTDPDTVAGRVPQSA